MGIIGALQSFANAYVLTSGGPENATLFSVLYILNLAFKEFAMGRAAAVAWVLFALIGLLDPAGVQDQRLGLLRRGGTRMTSLQRVPAGTEAGQRRNRLAGRVLSHAFLLTTTLILLFPLFYMLSRSLMDPSEINTLPPRLWPGTPRFENYIVALSRAPFALFLLNTLKILVLSVIGVTFSSALCGYAFARLPFPGP